MMGDDVVIYTATVVVMAALVTWAYLGWKRHGKRDDRNSGGHYGATSADWDRDRRGNDDNNNDDGGDGGGD